MLSKPQRQRDGKILRDMEYEYGHLKMSSWSSERNTHTHTHTHTQGRSIFKEKMSLSKILERDKSSEQ